MTIILLTFLSLILIFLIANLIGFGYQEFYLLHPDFLEGELYKADLKSGKLRLTFWTILTSGLFLSVIIARVIKNKKMINLIALLTFTIAMYLPILALINGKIWNGLIMGFILVLFLILTIWNIRKNKSKAHNNGYNSLWHLNKN